MTTLTRLRLNPTSRSLLRELADPVALHRRIMATFDHVDGADARAQLGILWRLDTEGRHSPVLLVQSHQGSAWDRLPEGWAQQVDTKDIDPALDAISSGQALRFKLRANATRKIDTKTGQDGIRRNGQRVPLRSAEAAVSWLRRHGESSGFRLVDGTGGPVVDVRPEAPTSGRRKNGTVTVEPVRFEGLLLVENPGALVSAIRSGIGPGKAFGCGLLSLAALPR